MARMYSMFRLESKQYCNLFLSLPLRRYAIQIWFVHFGTSRWSRQNIGNNLLHSITQSFSRGWPWCRGIRVICFVILKDFSSMFPTTRISFHFRWTICIIDEEDEDGEDMNCSCCFVVTGFTVRCHFFVVNSFLVFLWKLSYVFPSTSADHNPGLKTIVLHGIGLDVNPTAFQIIRIRILEMI